MADIYNGYIYLWRSFLDTSFFRKPNVAHIAVYFLLRANRKPAKIIFKEQEILIKPGQFITSVAAIATATGCSVREVRTAIAILKNVEFSTSKTTNKFTIITICNFEAWQFGGEHYDKLLDKPATNQRQTSDKPKTTDNKDNKDNKEKKDKKEEIDRVLSIVPYEDIIAHLNSLLKTFYKHQSLKTRGLIAARWKDGYRLEDFIKVHNKKYQEWGNDPKMSKFLRPITLYGTKFESYLNQPTPTDDERGAELDSLTQVVE